MMVRRRRPRNGLGALGGLEIEIMPIVWREGEVTVKDVFEEMYEKHKLAYTTIMTVMNRLANKGVLNQDRRTIPYLYTAAVSQHEMAGKMLDQVVDKVLGGSTGMLVSYCIDRNKLEPKEMDELKALKKMIEKKQQNS